MASKYNLPNLPGFQMEPCCEKTIQKCKAALVGTTLAQRLIASSPIIKLLTGSAIEGANDIMTTNWLDLVNAVKTLENIKLRRISDFAFQDALLHGDNGPQDQFWTAVHTIFRTAFDQARTG